jgi:hypothetical protein
MQSENVSTVRANELLSGVVGRQVKFATNFMQSSTHHVPLQYRLQHSTCVEQIVRRTGER